MTAERAPESHAYDLFILVLTVLSLAIMVVLLLPLSDATIQLLETYDTVICVVFLVDFGLRLKRAGSKRQYFVYERGWLDLLGSIPSFELLRYGGLLRLARLSRLARISRLLRSENRRMLVDDLLHNRGQYAAFITLMSGFTVLVVASVLVLEAEAHSRDANITSGGDALWWGIVTITTVGYGDRFPVTAAGRVIAVFVMFAGVGIIGSLASILASVLVAGPDDSAEAEGINTPDPTPSESELASLREELAVTRAELAALNRSLATFASDGSTRRVTSEAGSAEERGS